jgi:hypothetical protein
MLRPTVGPTLSARKPTQDGRPRAEQNVEEPDRRLMLHLACRGHALRDASTRQMRQAGVLGAAGPGRREVATP